jgi:translation initiation factor 1A
MPPFKKRRGTKDWKPKDDGLTEEQRITLEVSHTRMPRGNEVLGHIEQMLGGKRMYVECKDNKRRLCRVPGRARRAVWARDGDYVIVEPWEIQGDEKGDIIWKYKRHQVDYLRRKGFLEGI